MSVYAPVFTSTVASALRPAIVTSLALREVFLVSSINSFLLPCQELYTGEAYVLNKSARLYL